MSLAAVDPLLQPFDLKHLRLRNRIVSTSHEPAYSKNGMPKELYRKYHVEKARGGLALTMIGGSAVVAPDSPEAFGNLHVYKDEIVPWFKELSDAVHEAGALVMCQITHLGRRGSNYTADWLPLVSASPLREPAHRAFPKVAESWDLDRITRAYANAALRCQAGGLDGVELQANSHLLDTFWSPVTNLRADEWGGSLENRLRFPLQVVRAVRAAVGPDFVVGLRMAVDEEKPGGIDHQDGIAIAQRMVEEGIDFLSVVQGHVATEEGLSRLIPPMGTPSAPHLALAGKVKQHVAVPVMHAGRINDVATARHAISEGLLDLVGMTRAHIADPHIVTKLATGAEDRIRPCVGAGYCIDSIYQASPSRCIHNPSTGREDKLPHVVPQSAVPGRKAVVVGAGPAGLEAARALGERGHHVVVFEANSAPGGQLKVASLSPRRRDLIGIIDWRVQECLRLGVDFRYNTYAEADTVLRENPDIVVIATGGLPNTEFLDRGADLVTDTWDVLSGTARRSGEVLVFDDHGGHQALDAAEALLESGASVEYVTPERTVAPEVGGYQLAGLPAEVRRDCYPDHLAPPARRSGTTGRPTARRTAQ
jgi:N-methyl-L-proline demethylase